MKHAKPLSIAAALAIGLISMDAFAATPTIDNTPLPAQATYTTYTTKSGDTYHIADAGTRMAHRVYSFAQLDRDHTGQLTRSEIPADMVMLRTHFNLADFNHNGRLSRAELWYWEHYEAPQYIGTYPALVVIFKH